LGLTPIADRTHIPAKSTSTRLPFEQNWAALLEHRFSFALGT
jgi:hypothetical protein